MLHEPAKVKLCRCVYLTTQTVNGSHVHLHIIVYLSLGLFSAMRTFETSRMHRRGPRVQVQSLIKAENPSRRHNKALIVIKKVRVVVNTYCASE